MNNFFPLVINALILALVLALSHAILKWVSIQEYENYVQLLLGKWQYISLSLALYGLVFFYYILVLRSSPISSLYPIYTGLSVLFVMVIGNLLFNETVTISKSIGALFILSGIVLLGWNYQGQ